MAVRHEGQCLSCPNGKMRQETHNRVKKGSNWELIWGAVSKVLESCSPLVTGETQVGQQPSQGQT